MFRRFPCTWIAIGVFLAALLGESLPACEAKGANQILDMFCSVDRDGDGQIEHHEATKFLIELDGKEEDATKPPHFDEFSYGGKTICLEEMKDHLQNMLTADTVVSWITHGLQLPQYSEAFRKNAINGLDFLSLIENHSSALADELGVTSSLHRTKITSALVRQIFGYGAPPGTPGELRCQPSSCGGIQLNWEPPSTSGYPPLHKYLVYRWSGATSAWIEVADTKETSFFDSDELFLGKHYTYRVQAWGGHGPSEWLTVTNCTASARSAPFKVKTSTEVVKAQEVSPQEVVVVEENKKAMEVTPWGWIFSVNGGLFLLGILSRQSFFFRVTLAAWVVFKKFVKRVWLRIYATQTSDNLWLRTLALGLVSLCRAWMFVQRKVFILSRQACTKQTAGKVLTHCDSFRDAIGYSTPDCTIEEMVAAIQYARLNQSEKMDIARTVVTTLSERSKSLPDNLDEASESTSSSTLEVRSLSSPATLDDGSTTASSYAREHELPSHRKRTRHRCNHEGCKNRFDRWYYLTDWRMRFSKHYCRECQRVFCVKHTRISPHGPVGRCALDSTCICIHCFNSLSFEVQERLERINKLRVGPPVVSNSDSSNGSGEKDRDPFPPDFSTLTKNSLYRNQESG